MFYALPLSSDVISTGKLFEIQDYLTGASDNSMKRVLDGEKLQKDSIEIYFINSSNFPGFNEQWGDDVMDVLFLNDLAYKLLKANGTVGDLQEVNLPENVGTNLYVPFYS